MSEINEILKNNLTFVKCYDAALADKIVSINSLSPLLSMGYTDLNEANLYFDGIPVHAQSGAQNEAEKVVSTLTHNHKGSIHVVFGLGFGYVFKETVEKSNGSVILFEPDLQILRVALEMVDFTDVLAKNKVYITSDFRALERAYEKCFVSGSETALLMTKYHRTKKTSELNALIEKLGVLQGIYGANQAQRAKKSHSYAFVTVQNLNRLKNITPISKLKNKLKDIPAVIIAPGPSLNENIEILKQYRNNAIFFSVSTALSDLNKNGIYPDFVSMIEMFDASSIVKDCDLSASCLICEPYTHPYVVDLPFKNKFVTNSVENSANLIYNRVFGVSNDKFETKGTVAYNALFAAKVMGCSPIILVGQDLAYVDGCCYSAKSPLSDIKCRKNGVNWEVYVENRERLKENLYGLRKDFGNAKYDLAIDRKIAGLNDQLMSVKSVDGNDVPTSNVFALFAEYYRQFAEKYSSQITLYTTSKKGAYLGKFEYMPLEKTLFLESDVSKKVNLENVFKIRETLRPDINFLKEEIEFLTRAIDVIEAGVEDWERLVKDLSRNVLTEKSIKLLKKAVEPYLKISDTISPKSLVYREVTHYSRITVDSVMNSVSKSFDFNSAKRIGDGLKSFYVEDLGYLKKMLNFLKQQENLLSNEVSCPAG